jgi:hypothetical protein
MITVHDPAAHDAGAAGRGRSLMDVMHDFHAAARGALACCVTDLDGLDD